MAIGSALDAHTDIARSYGHMPLVVFEAIMIERVAPIPSNDGRHCVPHASDTRKHGYVSAIDWREHVQRSLV